MVLHAEASLILILCILQLPVKSDISCLQQSLFVILTLLTNHQAIKFRSEAENEAEMSHDFTRVNWAITTFLVSYSLLMTNEKRSQNSLCFYTADNNDHHMGYYNHNRLAVFFRLDSLMLFFITDYCCLLLWKLAL